MSLDNTIWIAGIVTEAAVVGLLVYRRIWRQLPLFCLYCVWDLAINLIGFLSQRFFPSGINWTTYLIQTAMDSVLQFCVLVEVAWSVLRPIRGSLPRFTIVVVGVILLVIGAAIWPFTTLPNLGQMPIEQQLLVHLQQAVAILRILFFLILAGCSQLLSLGWRDRELQVATGLGLYSPREPGGDDRPGSVPNGLGICSSVSLCHRGLSLLASLLGIQLCTKTGRTSRVHSTNAEPFAGCRWGRPSRARGPE